MIFSFPLSEPQCSYLWFSLHLLSSSPLLFSQSHSGSKFNSYILMLLNTCLCLSFQSLSVKLHFFGKEPEVVLSGLLLFFKVWNVECWERNAFFFPLFFFFFLYSLEAGVRLDTLSFFTYFLIFQVRRRVERGWGAFLAWALFGLSGDILMWLAWSDWQADTFTRLSWQVGVGRGYPIKF